MIRTCPRCELRFRSESELSQHLAVDHGADTEAFERFRYRSSRPVEPLYPQHARTADAPRRYLLVANQTLPRDEVVDRVKRLAAEGPATFHVVVPATHSSRYLSEHTHAEREVADTGSGGDPDDVGSAQARFRLREAVEALRAAGIDAEGEVGVADPFHAVEDAAQHVGVDEVILSTLPHGFSRWLDADLPARIRRRLGVPVSTVTSQS